MKENNNNNRLIIEFMKYPADHFTVVVRGRKYTYDELQFDTSHDWLTPVVRRCLVLANTGDEWDQYYDAIQYATLDSDIENLYEKVIDFITFYLSLKQEILAYKSLADK
ncbi:hypothetical protein GZH53_05640 [Flavihumibacter sp. R14]|nr:hypothetical protein [Flavihumibacter soli]